MTFREIQIGQVFMNTKHTSMRKTHLKISWHREGNTFKVKDKSNAIEINNSKLVFVNETEEVMFL